MMYSTEVSFKDGRTINKHYEMRGYSYIFNRHCGKPMKRWVQFTWGGTMATPPVYNKVHFECSVCGYKKDQVAEKDQSC